MALFSWAFRRRRVLSVTQPAWDELSLSSCDVNQFSAFCYTTRLGWLQPFLLWYESIQCHMIFESIIKVRLAWLRWGTVQFCLFRCNNAEFSVQMGNGSVCWDGERFSLVFFDVTMQSSLLRWGTVQFCLFRCNNVENRFSAFCYTTRLGWDSCVCVCGNAIV